MQIDGLDDSILRHILTTTRRIAVVGASVNPARPSYDVSGFLVEHGYDITPVNPGVAGQTLHGQTVVAWLDDAVPIDMIDVFRTPDQVPQVVDDAIRLGARTLWMQLGVIHEEAAARARAAGITVVMDRCPVIEIARLGLRHPA